jgi:hypothetical protein
MENDVTAPDPPKQSPPEPTRDPLIRYSVFAALGCAAACMIFTILYVFSYSLDTTLSFERHFDSYLAPANAGNLSTVLGLHMAQNRMFLQSCGMVAGIFFAFLGVALFLLGIQGTVDATGQLKDQSANVRRLAPGGIVLLASMIFVGVSAMRPVDFIPIAPAATIIAPTAVYVPPVTAPAAPTQSAIQPAPSPASPQSAHLSPQSAQVPPATQAPIQAKPLTASQPTVQTPTPILGVPPAQHPALRPALVPVKQAAATPPPAQHRFQP